jgi:hypothetical protein
MKIVDDDGPGAAVGRQGLGDLLVKGPWIMREYFKGEGGSPLVDGWFPTGDVATIDADGYMQITDRSKDVIKSGGEWISSIDVENIAMAHPAVAMAACIGMKHPKWDERPIVVVVKKPGAEVTAKNCWRSMRARPPSGRSRRRGVCRRHPAGCHRARCKRPSCAKCSRTTIARALKLNFVATHHRVHHFGPSHLGDRYGLGAIPERCTAQNLVRLRSVFSTGDTNEICRQSRRCVRHPAVRSAAFAQKGETVKMVRIDPLTGLLGPVGVSQLKGYQFFAEKFSGAGNPAGVKFEITFIDNKLSPTESLNALKAAIDQGVRYIMQGNGSSVALALSDAVTKHNERNPGKEVMYLNDSAVDPDLTNSKCSYWHFRFDADTSMKMEAMSSFMAQKDIKNVYILGQNYSHGVAGGQVCQGNAGPQAPDIKIVGEDLHPAGPGARLRALHRQNQGIGR